ncbi:MAG: hypothetical protein ABIC40_07780, partial [bacterium]
MKFRIIKSAFFITVLCLVFATVTLSGLSAQAEKPAEDSGAKTGGVDQPASDKPSETSKANEEMGKGIYWWADIDPSAIGAFPDFGIYNVAFRLGSLGVLSKPSAETGLPAVGWKDGGDFPKIATLPGGIRYRPVIETEASFWEKANPDSIVAFIKDTVLPGLKGSGIQFESIEIKLPEIKAGWANSKVSTGLETALKGMGEASDGTKVLVGVEPEIFSKIPWEQLTSIASGIDGFVVYFQDYDYSGLSPKITDRAWIDASLSEANRLGKPLTAVLPIYNRALYYPADRKSEMKIIPALDISRLAKISEVRSMGAAGTEYIVRETGEDFPFKPGDRIRIVESIKEVDTPKFMTDVRKIAP